MRSILADPRDGRLIWAVVVSLVSGGLVVSFVLADISKAAWAALGVAATAAVVAAVRAPRKRWPWVAVIASMGVGALVVTGWVAPIPRVAGTADNPVPFGVPGTLMSHDGQGYKDDLNTWEITVTDVYQGPAIIPTVEGDADGVCWFVVGVLRPVEGLFPGPPPRAEILTFDNGSTASAGSFNQCQVELDGPPIGEYYTWMFNAGKRPKRAVTFALGFPTLDTELTPTQVGFSDQGSGKRAVFELVTSADD